MLHGWLARAFNVGKQIPMNIYTRLQIRASGSPLAGVGRRIGRFYVLVPALLPSSDRISVGAGSVARASSSAWSAMNVL